MSRCVHASSASMYGCYAAESKHWPCAPGRLLPPRGPSQQRPPLRHQGLRCRCDCQGKAPPALVNSIMIAQVSREQEGCNCLGCLVRGAPHTHSMAPAWYRLLPLSCSVRSLVPRLTPSTSTPSASLSKVPPCPTCTGKVTACCRGKVREAESSHHRHFDKLKSRIDESKPAYKSPAATHVASCTLSFRHSSLVAPLRFKPTMMAVCDGREHAKDKIGCTFLKNPLAAFYDCAGQHATWLVHRQQSMHS